MLRSPAQDVHIVPIEYSVGRSYSLIEKIASESKYSVKQYYINYTSFDLTIMDSIGFKQTIPRKVGKGEGKDFHIVREYIINQTLEQEIRNRFNEVTSGDGEIIEAIRDELMKDDYLSFNAFDSLSVDRSRRGILVALSMRVKEAEIREHKTVECLHAGVIISRLKAELMPSHPSYAFINNKGFHPLSRFLKDKYVITCVRANYHKKLKERFYYTLGDQVMEVEYTNNTYEPEGIIVNKIAKDLTTDEIEETTILSVDFETSITKNRFFTSKKDAMLSIGIEKSIRERKVELDERELLIKQAEQNMRERDLLVSTELNHSKLRLLVQKDELDSLMFSRQITVAELQHENSVEMEKLKQKSLVLESKNISNKGVLTMNEFSNAVVTRNQEHNILMLKYAVENAKNRGMLAKAVISEIEDKRSAAMSRVKFDMEIQSMGMAFEIETAASKRKLTDERSKSFNQGMGIFGSMLKLIG